MQRYNSSPVAFSTLVGEKMTIWLSCKLISQSLKYGGIEFSLFLADRGVEDRYQRGLLGS